MNNLTAVSQQISGLVDDNRTQLKPAIDKLNGVLEILDNRKQELQRTLYLLRRYAMSFGEVLGSGPFFKASLVNLAPGQFAQPFIDAAFSDLGLDPNVLLPSELVDPGVGQPGTPALPVPFPRTGQGGEPHLTSARRDYRQPRRSGVRSAGCRCPALPLLPVPRAPARAPARRAAAGAARPRACARRTAAAHRRTAGPVSEPVAVTMATVIMSTSRRAVADRNRGKPCRDPCRGDHGGGHPMVGPASARTPSPRTSPMPTASTPATRSASWASRSERWRRSTRSRTARKSPSRSTAQYPVPADVRAAILSPSLVSARAIQLVPAYSGGPKLAAGATIPQDRTAVPVEWDDFRQQLEKLTDSLQPTTPGGAEPGRRIHQHRRGQPARPG